MFGTIVNGIGSLIGAAGQNANITKQIHAQQEENQKNREYNLMLAQQQNAWNVEQWERENEYNSPVNQMSRLKAAGINPNLAYSNGVSNLAAASPEMTSGAPSSPVDMSALGQRATLGQAIQMALTNEATRANIDNVKAQTRKTLADAGISETQLEYEDAKQLIGLDLMRQTYDKNSKEWQILGEELKQAKNNSFMSDIELVKKRIDESLYSRQANAIIKKLENDSDMSETNAKLAAKSLVYQLMGLEADAKIKQYESQFKVLLEDGSTLKDIISVIRLIQDNRK